MTIPRWHDVALTINTYRAASVCDCQYCLLEHGEVTRTAVHKEHHKSGRCASQHRIVYRSRSEPCADRYVGFRLGCRFWVCFRLRLGVSFRFGLWIVLRVWLDIRLRLW